MLTLDPVKLLIIAVVALLVLGPDKLPGAARKVSALLRDLRRLRASLHDQVHEAVGDHPLVGELTEARDGLVRLRASADPGQPLYRSIRFGPDDPVGVPDVGRSGPALDLGESRSTPMAPTGIAAPEPGYADPPQN